MNRGFAVLHPGICGLFFAFVLGFTAVFSHPYCRLISFVAALLYTIALQGKKALLFQLRMVLPLALLTMVLNPLFSHEGASILLYLPTGNPLTLESIFYGFGMALMLASLLCWGICLQTVMTTDRLLYLFGRISPAIALFLAMTLGFIPRLRNQIQSCMLAQQATGRNLRHGNLLQRISLGASLFSYMIGWSLEQAVQRADSMKSRGYGTGKPSTFSIFTVSRVDKIVFCLLTGLITCVLAAGILGLYGFQYYPVLKVTSKSGFDLGAMLLFAILCSFPLLINVLEEMEWRYTASSS